MKKQILRSIIAFLSIAIVLQSCQKEDRNPPAISSVSVNGLMGQDFIVMPGDSLAIRFTITDSHPLSQMKANIHDAADGHSHNGVVDTAAVVPNVGLWVDTRILALSGTTVTKTLYYVVPDTIHGVWHWELQAVDESGNSAEEVVVEFDVQ